MLIQQSNSHHPTCYCHQLRHHFRLQNKTLQRQSHHCHKMMIINQCIYLGVYLLQAQKDRTQIRTTLLSNSQRLCLPCNPMRRGPSLTKRLSISLCKKRRTGQRLFTRSYQPAGNLNWLPRHSHRYRYTLRRSTRDTCLKSINAKPSLSSCQSHSKRLSQKN